MFNRKFSSNIRKRKRMITSAIILLVVFLSVGYAVFSTSLGINGTLNVSKYDHTLYGVLQKTAKKSIYAKEYAGEHQDSMAGVGTEKIYHWWANNDTNGTTITDMNNVIFADHCWKMIRTTDTGGIKMIYNGESENNQCLNTRGNHVGYGSRTTQSLSTTYYYGTSYTYDKANNLFSLTGDVTTGAIQTGQYTCKQTTSTGTCSTLYLVDTLSSGTTYYVLPLNGNSHYSVFGNLQFSIGSQSLAYAGYMYNKTFPVLYKTLSGETLLSSTLIEYTSYYSDSYEYNTDTRKYSLINQQPISEIEDYSNLIGKYILLNSTNNSVCYVTAVNGSRIYYIQIKDGRDLNYYNYTYTYGTSYTDNGDGTYTINDPTTINRSDYYDYYNILNGKYVCKNANNNTCREIWHLGSTYDTNIDYVKSSDTYKYANSFSYENGTYLLSDDNVLVWDIINKNDRNQISNHHYTCFNVSGECSTLAYVYTRGGYKTYYINIDDGSNIEQVIDEMLYSNSVNTKNSVIKLGIDAWYKKYLSEYTNQLEDTIFCNDRSISKYAGFDPNNGSIDSNLYFSQTNDDELNCNNVTDKFSISNPKAKLIFPVGLLDYSELYILNNRKIVSAGNEYWLMTPYFYYDGLYSYYVVSNGQTASEFCSYSRGVRPVISLKPGTEYTSGSGSMADPYIVE